MDVTGKKVRPDKSTSILEFFHGSKFLSSRYRSTINNPRPGTNPIFTPIPRYECMEDNPSLNKSFKMVSHPNRVNHASKRHFNVLR